MKSGFVSVVGRPSSGKSTLINALCGYKVSIVSHVPQTTRNRIRGILSLAQGQIVLVDTPGYHQSQKRLNQQLNELVHTSLGESDAILYVVDSTRTIGEEENQTIALIKESQLPVVVVVNKIDLCEDSGQRIAQIFSEVFPQAKLFKTDALHWRGSSAIMDVAHALLSLLPEGDFLYPTEYVTDQTPLFRISEIIREKAINRLDKEVPHSLYVEIADLEQQENQMWIRAFIIVERNSQIGIVVGNRGEKIDQIRRLAKREIKHHFPDYAITLDLRVKANGKWRKNQHLLSQMIH